MIGFVGDPVAQGKAPGPLTDLLQSRGVNAVVVPMHVAPDRFDAMLDAFIHVRNLAGFVITVPHKAAAAKRATRRRPAVERSGVANVLRRVPGGWEADLFDGTGFVAGLRAKGINPRARRAAILGAGGAGTAIAFALADEAPERLRIHDKDAGRTAVLVERLKRIGAPAVPWDGFSANGDDLLVNATPVGMGGSGALPIAASALHDQLVVAEAVMEPELTPLLVEARGRGCAIHAGRHMMEGQLELMARFFSPGG